MAGPRHRHIARNIVLVLLGLGIAWVIRNVAGTSSPKRDPDQGPVIGSVDTWAAVPRSPEKAAANGTA
jgi:hypothetical protein